MRSPFLTGPIIGQLPSNHGGNPNASGCNGCTDCCHMLEISVTDEEASRVQALYPTIEAPLGPLVLRPDPNYPGWQLLQGPCPFRRLDTPKESGGCRIYPHRPSSCDRFTCAYLLDLRRNTPR